MNLHLKKKTRVSTENRKQFFGSNCFLKCSFRCLIDSLDSWNPIRNSIQKGTMTDCLSTLIEKVVKNDTTENPNNTFISTLKYDIYCYYE